MNKSSAANNSPRGERFFHIFRAQNVDGYNLPMRLHFFYVAAAWQHKPNQLREADHWAWSGHDRIESLSFGACCVSWHPFEGMYLHRTPDRSL